MNTTAPTEAPAFQDPVELEVDFETDELKLINKVADRLGITTEELIRRANRELLSS